VSFQLFPTEPAIRANLPEYPVNV